MDIKEITAVAEKALEGTDMFVVECTITPDNTIDLTIDSDTSVSIDTCAMLNRAISEAFNRDEEDYELEVGSAGIGQPFKVLQQYVNHIGKEVEVLACDGKKYRGVLARANEEAFAVVVKVKEKPEGAKRPIMVDKEYEWKYNEVKYTKYLINF